MTMMSKLGIVGLTFFHLAMLAKTDASSSSITVQPGPVEVKQGNDITLWCKMKQDTIRLVPVIWQSPPSFRTRTTNCVSFVREKYGISCGESSGWYNMTIKDVQWADRGKYRCIHTSHTDNIELKVLVPVGDVSLTSTTKPLVLRKGVEAMLICSTDCAYPAPKISWFENGQPFKDSTTVNTTELVCSGEKQGQKQTKSTVLVRGEYMEKERNQSIISCAAGNAFGEKRIFKAIVVTYDDPCQTVWCRPGRVCQATSENTGVCVCGPPYHCNGHHKQVCGDDGIMYPSHCELHRMACIKDKHVRVYHINMCKPKVNNNQSLVTQLVVTSLERTLVTNLKSTTVAISGDVLVVIASIAVTIIFFGEIT